MRKRQEIENNIFGNIDTEPGMMQWLQLEVMLDIRDLLLLERQDKGLDMPPQGEGCGIGCKDPNCPDKYVVKKSPQGDSIVEEV